MNSALPQSPSLRILLALGGAILALLICLLCALSAPGLIGSPTTPTTLAQAATPSGTPTASTTPTASPTGTTASIPTLTPSATRPPTNTFTPQPCVPNAAFVGDVTVPAGTMIAPGAPFIKTWRVKNTGKCTWDSTYSLVFVEGLALGPGTAPVPLAEPGAVVDISLPMTAPLAPGNYHGTWRLRASSGSLFGANLAVLINVVKPTTPTPTYTPTATPTRPPLFDFVKHADIAEWSDGQQTLAFPGGEADPQGFVIWRDVNYPMEDGSTPPLSLETHPQWVTGGYIEGYYGKFPYAPRKGDLLHVKVGFLNGAGAGDVTFNVAYDSCGDDCWVDLFNVEHAYTGTLIEQSIDIYSIMLGHLSTRTTTFRLRVSANNQGAAQDWATWAIAQIERP